MRYKNPTPNPRAVSFHKTKKFVNIVRDKSLSNCHGSITISTKDVECNISDERKICRSVAQYNGTPCFWIPNFSINTWRCRLTKSPQPRYPTYPFIVLIMTNSHTSHSGCLLPASIVQLDQHSWFFSPSTLAILPVLGNETALLFTLSPLLSKNMAESKNPPYLRLISEKVRFFWCLGIKFINRGFLLLRLLHQNR